jgi:LacI family transcriptional regulator
MFGRKPGRGCLLLKWSGCVPNEQALAMRTRRTGTIGVVTGRITNPFYPELIDALSNAITRRGLRMVLWASDAASGETGAMEAMRGRLVDGIIFTSATEGSPSLTAAVELELPIVLVIRSLEGIRYDQVTSDNRLGGARAAELFLQAGRTDVAVVGGSEAISTGRERRAGFLEYLRDRGIVVPNERIIDSDFSHDAAKEAGRTLFASHASPRAIFCVNDVIAFGVLDAAKEQGISVPDDAWVIGYDNTHMSSWNLFDLTTLTQPVHEIAEMGVQMLLRRVNNKARPVEYRRFTPNLIVRGSAPGR